MQLLSFFSFFLWQQEDKLEFYFFHLLANLREKVDVVVLLIWYNLKRKYIIYCSLRVFLFSFILRLLCQ